MSRRTVAQARWPDAGDFCELARRWQPDSIVCLLRLVWQGYDTLTREVLSEVDVAGADLQLERQLTQLLVRRIRSGMSGLEPYVIEHGPFEFETQHRNEGGQPPQCDIGFVLKGNERLMWPLEAKVLRTAGAIAEYANAVREQFLMCRYAPFSSQASMLGYLLSGSPRGALRAIAGSLACELEPHPGFPDRDHDTSDHMRQVPPGKDYPVEFRCHHMMMPISGWGRS